MGINDIGEYPMIYLAFPEMLKKSTADKTSRLCRERRQVGQ